MDIKRWAVLWGLILHKLMQESYLTCLCVWNGLGVCVCVEGGWVGGRGAGGRSSVAAEHVRAHI